MPQDINRTEINLMYNKFIIGEKLAISCQKAVKL